MKIEDNTEVKQPIPEVPSITIPKEDYINFYKTVILSGKDFIKSYQIEDSILKFRTRTSEESDGIIKEVLKAQKDDPVWAAKLMNDLNLAYSLHSFADDEYYKIPIEDRKLILNKFPAPKKTILFSYLEKFENYVGELMRKYENF